MPILTWEGPADQMPNFCPEGCGGVTEDPYGGPCKACWRAVDDRERETDDDWRHSVTPMTPGMVCDPTGHDWHNDPANRQHPDEGLTCSRCGVTEAELDAMEHGLNGGYDD